MDRRSYPVEIIGVDTDTLEKDNTFPEAYAFYISLSAEPDPLWQTYLDRWKKALYSMQRAVSVPGNKLRLVFVYGDDIQSYAEYVGQLVRWVNERIVEHDNKVEVQKKTELGKQELSRKKEDEIREELGMLEPEQMPATVEVTVEELLSIHEVDEVAANAKFANKILKVTGVVGKIEVKDKLAIYYINLESTEKTLLQNVRCTFGKKHGPELNQLAKGQTVTVQGKYDGYTIDIFVRDCVLVC